MWKRNCWICFTRRRGEFRVSVFDSVENARVARVEHRRMPWDCPRGRLSLALVWAGRAVEHDENFVVMHAPAKCASAMDETRLVRWQAGRAPTEPKAA